MNDKNVEKLKTICDEIINKFTPQGEVTYCNLAVDYVMQKYGYNDFKGLTANQIGIKVKSSSKWLKIGPVEAQNGANSGIVNLASFINPLGHGHVAVIYPGNTVFSGKWRTYAPLIANVGRNNGIKTANEAFKEQPNYYMWLKNI